MHTLTPEELKILYNNFVYYRDYICNGQSNLTIIKFYNIYGLNKCDQFKK